MTIQESYDYCRRVARTRAKNFYYSFVLLRNEQRDAMCAIYAFMRYCDDLSDEPGTATPAAMQQWRADLDAALDGRFKDHPVWPAFHHTVVRYRIPHAYFHDMIDGVSSDLEPRRMESFEDLYQYCYRVASVVGLTIIHIFGFEDPHAIVLAEKCGVAFQLTNIVRDVKEDRELGRVYLPGIDKLEGEDFRQSLREYAARARGYYTESMPLIAMVHPECRASLWALIEIYSRLLKKIEESNFDVMARRIRLSTAEKLWVVLLAALRKLRA
jgi:15-cis-phytoene synthase